MFLRLAISSYVFIWASVALPTFSISAMGSSQQPSLPVTSYLSASAQDGGQYIVIGAGKAHGVLEGAILRIFRRSHIAGSEKGIAWIPTGTAKAAQVSDTSTIAIILDQGSGMSAAVFPRHPGIMVGDNAELPQYSISPNLAILPSATLQLNELFLDPKAYPQSLELLDSGKELLRQVMEPFMTARVARVIIEGHTDPNGSSETNQVESYQRALIIRQFLVTELGFLPERVVAIGFGEAEAPDESFTPDYQDRLRRIVIRTLGDGES